ncbi:MAG: response regulator [Chloroflexota bacterium]
MHVLVVDDEPVIRGLLVTILQDAGYVVDEAGNGAEALQKVQTSLPNAIVLDLLMPVMDGFQFLEHCRLLPGCEQLPIVVLSASHVVLSDERVRAFVKKPFDLNVFVAAVEAVVRPEGQ